MNTAKTDTVRALSDAIHSSRAKTSAYDTIATVRRVVGKTAYVHIPGGVDETPVSMTISADVGDVVQVRVGGGKAWITGNSTAPPTDDHTVKKDVSTVNKDLSAKIQAVADQTDITSVVAALKAVQALLTETIATVTELSNSKANADGDDIIDLINDADETDVIDASKLDADLLTGTGLPNDATIQSIRSDISALDERAGNLEARAGDLETRAGNLELVCVDFENRISALEAINGVT